MKKIKTKDPVNQPLISLENERGLEKIGLMNSAVWHEDPKRLVFTLSRYKFTEIGCGDGFGARIVRQEVKHLTITDYDQYFIQRFNDIKSDNWPISAFVHNILDGPLERLSDAIYSLDVLEHISVNHEDIFIKNIINSLSDDGVVILGMPSIESQTYASPASKDGHVNCKTGKDLKSLLEKYFHNVFLFSI